MKPLLLTGYDDTFAPLGDLTSPIMAEYAERQGMDFLCVREFPADCYPAWHKIRLMRAALERADTVLWMDADILLTNLDFCPLPHLRANACLHVSMDWGEDARQASDFTLGCFVATKASLPIWEEALREPGGWPHTPLWDQGRLQEMYAALAWVRQATAVYHRRLFNAVPDEVCPGHVIATWRPGDWTCHLTMLPLPRRVALFHRMRERIGACHPS